MLKDHKARTMGHLTHEELVTAAEAQFCGNNVYESVNTDHAEDLAYKEDETTAQEGVMPLGNVLGEVVE